MPSNQSDQSVRLYQVTDTMLAYDFSHPANRLTRAKGEQITSAEFVPPESMTAAELEQRYIETGAVVLVRTLTTKEYADLKMKQA